MTLRSASAREARAAMERERGRGRSAWPHPNEPVYGVSTGFGSLATRRIPADAPRGAAARAGPLARRRHGPAGRARGRAGDDAAARADAGDGPLGRAPGGGRDDRSRCSTPASRRSSRSTARSAPAAISRRWRTARWRCSARARSADAAARCPRPRRSPPPGIAPLELAAKEGLALINGTDGMLGHAGARARTTCGRCCGSPTSPPRCRSRRCSAPTARSPPTCARCGPSPARRASAANLRALLAGSAIVASHRHGDPRVQDAYSLRCAPQVHGAARDTLDHAERGRRRGAALGDRQPDGAARRPGRVVRQLPRRTGRATPATSSPSRPPTSARSPSAAPTGCSTRPARTGCRRSWPPTPASTPA